MGNGGAIGKRWAEAAAPLSSAARSAPESFLLLALFVLSSAAAQRAGALPGGGLRLHGLAATSLFCAFLYGALGTMYLRASPGEGSARRVLRRLGVCLVLAVATTYGIMRLLPPDAWDKFFYLRYPAFPASAALWCAALLPRESRGLLRAAAVPRPESPLPPLACLLAAAAVLITASDLALQLRDVSIPGIRGSVIQKNAWVTGTVILFAFYALAFAATLRVGAALLVVTPLFSVLGLSTLVKMKYMHSPVVPLDLLSLREFLPFFRSFFGDGVFAASVFGLVAWAASLFMIRRTAPRRVRPLHRRLIGGCSLAVLAAFPLLIWFFPKMEIERRIGAPSVYATGQQESTRTSGFLLSFLSEIPASFVAAPSGYSGGTVASALRRYPAFAAPPAGGNPGRRVNLILYMVESLMDPDDLGWRCSSDPMPNLHALKRNGHGGACVVPGKHNGSSDSEFEALTGMTMSFLPQRSLAYRQFVRAPIPSLPAALKRLGYRTFAVQADPKGFYNREEAYRQIGFDEVFWLNEAREVERAVDPFWPSDNAIVDTVIRASRGKGPFFAFAFPSSTHSPYNRGLYGNSGLEVLDPPPGDAAAEVKEYINLLRDADRAIGRLIGHFRKRPEPTVIVIVGDHLPPLSDESLRRYYADLPELPEAAREWKQRSVPLLVWANFDLPHERVRLSMNALPPYLLGRIGVAPGGFLAVTDAFRLRFPVLSEEYLLENDGSVRDLDSVGGDGKVLVDDYRLIQYDLLIGKRHALRQAAGDRRISFPFTPPAAGRRAASSRGSGSPAGPAPP
jgi:hypothetical protein